MLVLTRKPGQSIMIGEGIEVQVLSVSGEKVRLGISAPRDVADLPGRGLRADRGIEASPRARGRRATRLRAPTPMPRPLNGSAVEAALQRISNR